MPSRTANHLAGAPAANGRNLRPARGTTRPLFHLRPRPSFALALATLLALGVALLPLRADDTPDPRAILQTVRVAQSAQNSTLSGEIRTGSKSLPFRLISSQGTVRYEFSDPAQVIQLRLGESDARLEEIAAGKSERVSPRRFTDQVRDTDITYEDLSLGFLYWTDAKVRGEQTMLLQKCWIIRVEPSRRGQSQYSKVDLWISQKNGALMQAEAFDSGGKVARRFKVISGQPIGDGLWILKQMRIESPQSGRFGDRTPTYLEIDKPRT